MQLAPLVISALRDMFVPQRDGWTVPHARAAVRTGNDQRCSLISLQNCTTRSFAFAGRLLRRGGFPFFPARHSMVFMHFAACALARFVRRTQTSDTNIYYLTIKKFPDLIQRAYIMVTLKLQVNYSKRDIFELNFGFHEKNTIVKSDNNYDFSLSKNTNLNIGLKCYQC